MLTSVSKQTLSASQTRMCAARPTVLASSAKPVQTSRAWVARSQAPDAVPAPSPAAVDSEVLVTPSASQPAAAAEDTTPEVVLYEGSGSNAELAFSVLMLATLVYAPLSIQVIGRRIWIKYKFTNKRIVVINTSPVFKKEVQFLVKDIKEIRIQSRALGSWGDMVVFLKSGQRLEFVGMEKVEDLKRELEASMPGARL